MFGGRLPRSGREEWVAAAGLQIVHAGIRGCRLNFSQQKCRLRRAYGRTLVAVLVLRLCVEKTLPCASWVRPRGGRGRGKKKSKVCVRFEASEMEESTAGLTGAGKENE